MEHITDSDLVMGEWECVNAWAERNFQWLDPNDCWHGWKDIEKMLMEGRSVTRRLGRGEEYPKSCTAEDAHVQKSLEHYEEEASRGADGIPIPSAP
jgi:hypothetical protein